MLLIRVESVHLTRETNNCANKITTAILALSVVCRKILKFLKHKYRKISSHWNGVNQIVV